jgi:hypothetical protein
MAKLMKEYPVKKLKELMSNKKWIWGSRCLWFGMK